jgi:capsular polysaccharide biosynthesis protein
MLLKHLWMLVVAAMICSMSVSLFYSWVYEPVYRASMTYVVLPKQSDAGVATLGGGVSGEVTAVLGDLVQSDMILSDIRSYDPELADFSGTLRANRVGESNMIIVRADAGSPAQAYGALNALREVFPSLSNRISNRAVVHLIKSPAVSAYPINQVNHSQKEKTAFLAGFAAMAAILCWLSISRETIQTKEGARRLLDSTILAVVGHERKNRTVRAAIRKLNKGIQVFSLTTSRGYVEAGTCSDGLYHGILRQKKLF